MIDGDERVRRFDDLWAANAGALHAYAARRVGPEAAADVVSDTFLVVWRRLDEPQVAERPWLFGVARNVIRQQGRSTARLERLRAALDPPGSVRSAEDAAIGRGTVADALAGLDELDAEIVLLTAWEGLTSQEISRVVGLRAAAVRMRLSRARRVMAAAERAREERRDA